ncbi:MAG: SAM-dependent chlorinase/fluorinase [Bacteroidales bacterium]|nr:SAM-dependent chlorinase/fluorinase [Bacteroidales bacterium]
MRLITLTTDWGNQGFYGGMVKGFLYDNLSDINVVDITHDITPFYVQEAAFVVRNACLNFPKDTIHIIDVNSYESTTMEYVVVKANEQYFICTDNGLPALVFKDMDVEIYGTEYIWAEREFYTFGVWEKFCEIAKILATANTMETLGTKRLKFETMGRSMDDWRRDGDFIVCNVVFIDSYGNVFLSITKDDFLRELDGRKFELRLEIKKSITQIQSSYQDVSNGEPLLTVSVTNNLELALKEGDFARLLGYKVNREVRIKIL